MVQVMAQVSDPIEARSRVTFSCEGWGDAAGLGNVAFMILGWIEMCPRPVGSAFQRRTLRRYQAS